ncbi:MAG: tail fiber domain-containing protein [Verrucomicrobia bacterium]|nr:tail fiber domain-containing protein [Verrucomicrobiota bacterium]
MKTKLISLCLGLAALLVGVIQSNAQGTAFTYQGRLTDPGGPVNGPTDFEFRLFDAVSGGTQQGATVAVNDLIVSNGVFTATLDFGNQFTGGDRFLQIAARPGASTGAFTILNPRQRLTSAPYAVRALEAAGLPVGTVSSAMLADGAVTAGKLAPGAVSQLGASDGSPANAVQVNTNGLVGIGTNSPAAGLHVAASQTFFNPEVVRLFRDESGGLTNLYGVQGVAVDGNLMAVTAVWDSGVTLFDVSDPSNPVFTAQVRSGNPGFAGLGQIYRVALRSNLLAVATYEGDVTLLDVSDRYAPVMGVQLRDGQGGWNELSGVNSLAFSGNLLAIAARLDSAVTLADVSNPANPIKRAELKDGFFGFTNLWGASALAFRGSTLFIGSDQDRAVTVVDVSNPVNPVKLGEFKGDAGSFQSFGYITALAVSGNTLAVGSDLRLTLVDVANPAAPVLRAQLDNSTQPAIAFYVSGLAVSQNLLAVGYGYQTKATVLNVSQPAAPVIHATTDRSIGSLSSQNSFSSVAFAGTNLVVTFRDAGAVSVLRLAPRQAGLVSSGWVGIGVNPPAAALHVVGDVIVDNAREMNVGASALNVSAGSVSLGAGARVESLAGGTAIGENSLVSGNEAAALGNGTLALGDYSLAAGYRSEASGLHATAIGTVAKAGGNYSVSLGNNTVAGGRSATALGELSEALGDRSLAAGMQARAEHAGSFVWADAQGTPFFSTTNNQFSVRASGGVRLETSGAGLAVDGQQVLTTPGGGQAFELSVGGQRALRLEPTSGTPNILGGYAGNIISNGVSGAVVGGGGGVFAGTPYPHRVGGDFAAVLGGLGNTAAGIASTAFGNQSKALAPNSTAFGSGTISTGQYAVAMGAGTLAGGRSSTSMGESTVASGHYSTALGYGSVASGDYALAAGRDTVANGANSMALGCSAHAAHDGSFVWSDQQIFGFSSTTSNQFNIRASGGVRLNNDTSLSFGNQTRQMINLWNAEYGIGVQSATTYFRSGNDFAWFKGGSHSDTAGSAGAGGSALMCLSRFGNLGLGTTSPGAHLDVVAGQGLGRFTSTNSANGAVLILRNTSDSPGYLGAINFETAADTPGQIGYLASGQMSFRAGGVERMTLSASGLTVNGTFVSSSDRNAKENFQPVNPQEVLEKVAALPVSRWNYKDDTRVRHLGPMAQDFHAAFGLGADDKHIATVDADGVALAAIQGLNEKVEVRSQNAESQIRKLAAENADLKAELAELKQLVRTLAAQQNGDGR